MPPALAALAAVPGHPVPLHHAMRAAVLLAFVLGALWRYVAQGRAQVVWLRQTDVAYWRRRFFADKIRRQAVMMLAVPLIALVLDRSLAAAWTPHLAFGSFGQRTAVLSGINRAALLAVPLGQLLGQLAGLVVVLELVPLLLRSRRVIGLGNFAVLRARNLTEAGFGLVLAVGAGFGEELLFRACIPQLLLALGLAPLVACALAVLLFGACHAYQGPVGVVATTLVGAVLTVIYLATDSLLIVAVLHSMIDLVGLVVRPLVGLALAALLGLIGLGPAPQPRYDIFR